MSLEAEVLADVRRRLRKRHLMHFRMTSGLFKRGHRHITVGEDGMADVLVFVDARIEGKTISHPLWIETKSRDGELRPEQRAFRARVMLKGHTYLLVRHGEELEAWLEVFSKLNDTK